ncbi:MAG: thiamine-phosphate kinase [Halofilum sp. (in: g-proteobacteria)]|nr:thiamine-phosphate kinase [Halofilum sp. (in: g-proteobacteria)]
MTDEFELIRRHFAALTPTGDDVLRGPGDDCALLRPPPERDLAVSIDTLVEDVHFPAATAPGDIGWKSLACGLSDLAAAGACPSWCLLSLTCPSADEDWLAAFAHGFGALAQREGVTLAGGDMSRGGLSVTVQVAGYVERGRGLTRAGACPGDGVFVSGWPGRAAAGLARCLASADQPDDPLAEALNRPQPRTRLGRQLAAAGVSACIDVSDGLAADLGHILAASAVGAELEAAALPVAPELAAAGSREQVRDWLLGGGDDYELCFTGPYDLDVERLAEAGEVAVTRIGRITAGGGLQLVEPEGGRSTLVDAVGYRHFSS